MVKSSLIFIYLYFASTPALQSSRYARKIKIFRLTWKDKRLYYESFQEIIVSISRWEHTLKTFNHLEKELFINEGREQNKVSNFLIFFVKDILAVSSHLCFYVAWHNSGK